MSEIKYSLEDYNRQIINWKNAVRRRAVSNVLRLTKSEQPNTRPLAPNLKTNTRKDIGAVIYSVGFKFPRHGVFVHKGVGRGWEMVSGKVVRTAKSKMIAPREPKDWLNSEIDSGLEDLADKLVEMKADAVVVATRAKIK
jgi:hypothetical protein